MKNSGKKRRKKQQNRILIVVIIVLACIAAGSLIYLLSRYQHTSADRLPDEYEGQIEAVRSGTDQDNDGIDDQTDILQVYFEHTAVSLTTDISEIEEWQGGDIVVFENHIGIVSDRRNENGVPYVIHHNDPLQTRYEQDILEKRDDITGHFRMK